ncbi:28S ribosomal protein S35, mitochondrial isoform X2 [Exaiptasia diaphana]|uniref:Small ribosomal subunit protein mS35 mitochondrial conserved domain-containing protein n=1 Tax=Exaiptasia diaphana TaxID=2652724 RepID=A0A913WTJ1_EXADI|nr:28S ribosomal protein S35, mitochondrial isoform X2 [Exaiptasia diaphana]KXJ18051.1 28S ribosomal protein S35, mitochondrial [Exaiptasia diaphana]
MAAAMRRFTAQKVLEFRTNSCNVGIINSYFRKSLPCCSYVTYVGKAASGMMRQNAQSNRNKQGRSTLQKGRRTPQKGSNVLNHTRSIKMSPETTDWPSVYSGSETYNPSVIPIMVRMGRYRHNRTDKMPNRSFGNIELMKIPNFFHLSPPAIQRQSEAIKHLCKPWPTDLNPSTRPIRVITRNYLFAGPSLYHPRSRKVKIQISLKDLILDEHARNKLIELVGPRYDKETDTLTIVTDRCPTRKQNKDYALYLLTVLYHEAWKTESWEADAIVEEPDVAPETIKNKRRSPKRFQLIGDELYRLNQYGKAFKVDIKTKV